MPSPVRKTSKAERNVAILCCDQVRRWAGPPCAYAHTRPVALHTRATLTAVSRCPGWCGCHPWFRAPSALFRGEVERLVEVGGAMHLELGKLPGWVGE